MRVPVNQPYRIANTFGVPDSSAAFGRHAGIDYAVPVGREVYAPVAGVVTDYVWGQYHGNVVQIYDGKYYWRLMHNSSLKVKPNARVAEGQLVALSGATGQGVTGPHVHEDVAKDKFPPNFASFVNRNTIKEGEEKMTIPNEDGWYARAAKLYRQFGLPLSRADFVRDVVGREPFDVVVALSDGPNGNILETTQKNERTNAEIANNRLQQEKRVADLVGVSNPDDTDGIVKKIQALQQGASPVTREGALEYVTKNLK